MIKTAQQILAFLGVVFIVLVVYSYTTNADSVLAGQDKEEVDDSLPQKVKAIQINKSFSFSGERVPLENFDTKERLIKELTVNSYYHSSTIQAIMRSGRHFPVLRKILAEEGVPQDFLFLSVAESNLENVTSPAGAKGFWQFMTPTAKHYGLEISSTVDERYHIEKATRAACQLLKDYKKRFGTWTLAAAAYNMGETRLAKVLKAQRADTYYELNMNVETNRYIFRILALKEIMTEPQSYGFYIDPSDVQAPLHSAKSISVSQSIPSLGEFAKEHGCTYRLLKVYNPWLIKSKLNVAGGKNYEIALPY